MRMYGNQGSHRPHHGRFRWDRLALAVLFVSLVIFGGVKLVGYIGDLLSTIAASKEMRQVYYDEPIPAPAAATAAPDTPAPSVLPTLSPSPSATAAPAVTNIPQLKKVSYPGNPNLQINRRFKALRKENRDIVGWLTMTTLLDEPVMQRDETYYMDHDLLGKPNVNGALFLDSGISLKTRPYSLVIYGHNMKTGAMFGCLRNYENLAFYHNNPFIAFHSIYEEGEYVIFAAGCVSTEPRTRHYVDFIALNSTDYLERKGVIDTLIAASVHTCFVDVNPEDQLLILVTCTEKDGDRRMLAARRVRDGEDEAQLKKLVEKSWKK